jgi:hypothetical protein
MAATRISTRQLKLSEDKNYATRHAADTVAVGDISLAAPGANIGGLAMVLGQTVLLVDQAAPPEHGKYVWDTAATPLVRSDDLKIAGQFILGAEIYIRAGDDAGSVYRLTTIENDPLVVNTDDLEFTLSGTPTLTTFNTGVQAIEAPNGIITAFTSGGLTAAATNLAVYINGVRMRVGGGFDYTFAGGTVTMTVAPLTGDYVMFDWQEP